MGRRVHAVGVGGRPGVATAARPPAVGGKVATKQIDARLRKLEAKAKAKASALQAEQMTPAEAVDCMLDGMRHGGLTFADGQWCASSDWLEDIAAWLNTQPGALIVPLWPREFTAAIDALDAGRFALQTQTYQPHVKGPPLDHRTGTPILGCAQWAEDLQRLARNVQTAVYHVWCQTAGALPVTLEDFAAWLRELQPYALPAEWEDHAQS